jgi:hypothetical protein
LFRKKAHFRNRGWIPDDVWQSHLPACRRFTRSMPEIARRNTIKIGEAVVRAGSKIEARDQVEQASVGAICGSDRQRFLVKSFDIAADEGTQQPAQRPLLGIVAAQRYEFLLEGLEGSQAMMLLRKPRV